MLDDQYEGYIPMELFKPTNFNYEEFLNMTMQQKVEQCLRRVSKMKFNMEIRNPDDKLLNILISFQTQSKLLVDKKGTIYEFLSKNSEKIKSQANNNQISKHKNFTEGIKNLFRLRMKDATEKSDVKYDEYEYQLANKDILNNQIKNKNVLMNVFKFIIILRDSRIKRLSKDNLNLVSNHIISQKVEVDKKDSLRDEEQKDLLRSKYQKNVKIRKSNSENKIELETNEKFDLRNLGELDIKNKKLLQNMDIIKDNKIPRRISFLNVQTNDNELIKNRRRHSDLSMISPLKIQNTHSINNSSNKKNETFVHQDNKKSEHKEQDFKSSNGLKLPEIKRRNSELINRDILHHKDKKIERRDSTLLQKIELAKLDKIKGK